MISVEDAQKSILEMIRPMGRERAGLLNSLGRVLAEDVHSSRPVPPWNNSAMDGYALRAEDVRGATRESPRSLRVIEEIQAGVMATREVGPGEAIKIMTGAPIPEVERTPSCSSRRPRESPRMRSIFSSPCAKEKRSAWRVRT